MTTPADPFAVLRTKKYVALLILAAVLGVVISFLVYWYLKLITDMQTWVFTDLPKGLGFHGEPPWWPLLPLAVAGAMVGATIRYLPGRGGHSPADGFKAGGVAQPDELPGIFLAALAGLGLGAVVGPEAPLIALGGGLAVLAVKLARRDVPASTGAVIAATGSFAAISTLLGNPLSGAFLLLEASGLGGPMATIVLIPGLLGAGVGSLIFLGLDAWTGYGTFSLAIPDLPPAAHLDVAQFGWARSHRGSGRSRQLRDQVAGPVPAPARGAAAGAAHPAGWPGHRRAGDRLRRGDRETVICGAVLRPDGAHAAAGTCRKLHRRSAGTADGVQGARVLHLAEQLPRRPDLPGMFIGAVGGIALSHLPGLPMIAGAAIGIGAMTAGMLQLPMTAVLLTTLFLGTDGINVMPLVIVAVVVSFVLSKWLAGPPTAPQVPEPEEATTPPQVR